MNKNYLNKDVSKAIHGIAILMMIYHHIFINGNIWIIDESKSIFDLLNIINFGRADTFQQSVAWFCRICVTLFAFSSGYGIYSQLNNKLGDKLDLKQAYKYCLKRIWSFYLKYLIVFVIFVGATYINKAIYIEDTDPLKFVLSLLGLSTYYNDTWWYVSQYYFMVLCAPLVYVLLKKFKLKHYLIIVGVFVLATIIALATGNIMPFLKFFSSNIQTQLMMFLIIFIEGMFVSRFDIINYLCNRINKLVAVLIVIIVFVLRVILIRAPSDSLFDIVLIIPYMIGLSKLLYDHKNTFLKFFGTYSTYMWLVHSYFYAYIFFDLVARCDYSIVVYLQVVIYSLATGILLTKIENLLKNLKKS